MPKKNQGKKKVGRPTKQDPETVTKLLAAFGRGFNVTESCIYACITRETYYRWLSEDSLLSYRIEAARTGVSGTAKEVVVDAIMKGDVNAAKWWLERRNKKEFGPNAEETPDEQSYDEIAEEMLQSQINQYIAGKYKVWLFHKREVLLAEYSKKNEYLISRLDKLIKLPDKELADYADLEIRATGQDPSGVRRMLIVRQGGENYEDIIKIADETKQQYEAWQAAQEEKNTKL